MMSGFAAAHDRAERSTQVLEVIPPCPQHGRHCPAHALAWVWKAKLLLKAIEQEIGEPVELGNGLAWIVQAGRNQLFMRKIRAGKILVAGKAAINLTLEGKSIQDAIDGMSDVVLTPDFDSEPDTELVSESDNDSPNGYNP